MRFGRAPAVACTAAVAVVAVSAIAWPRGDAGPAAGAPGTGSRITAVNPAHRVELSLTLRLPRAAAMQRFLGDIADPRSPRYGQTLTPAQFGTRFGLSDRQIASLGSQLGAHGLRVVGGYPQRTALRVRGTAAAVAAAFSTRLVERTDARGRRFRQPVRKPRLPSWLGADVTAVTGLDTRPVLHPAAVPLNGLGPSDLAAAYHVRPLQGSGLAGAGQTVAIMSFDTFDPQDVAAFEGKFAIRGPAIEKVPVNGGVGSPGDGQDEVNLDVDTVRAIAPRAKILDFEATNGEAGFAEMMNAIVADGRSKIVSISWGRCDLRLPPGVRNADEAAFSAAAAAGVTTYVAAGDEGAYDCQSHDLADQRLSVDWPSAGANVVAVGGTRLSVRGDGTYLEEFGWENILAGVGGGGGLASETQRPAWQTGVSGIDNRESNGRRQIPDVSGPADPASGLNVMSKGRFQASVGGTSAAAPFWGAITALVHGYAKQQGARRPGFMGPLLYRAAARFPKAFHDVTKGGNRHFNAAPGWDYATGLGSPDATELAKAVVSLVGR